MSCPCFYPVEPRTATLRAETARLPLGDSWSGLCYASAAAPATPEDSALQPLCNLGYVRGACRRFPAADDAPDAARFTIARDDGAALHLYYVLERDHRPFAHGPLEYSRSLAAFIAAPASETLARQAWAYVQSYLRRTSR
jgi:hypothetical protein